MSENSPIDALKQFRQQQASRYAGGGSDALVGISPTMACARAQVDAAVASAANVLIAGHDPESLAEIAEAIHYRRYSSGEAALWRVHLDAALPSELARALGGLLRDSSPATLLVESIDQMPADQQVEILTAMASADWQAQVLATRPIAREPARVGMSDELAAALSTIVIEVPPLADRPEDILPLAEWHIERLNRDAADAVTGLADDALDVLMIHTWPGEGQELAQVVASAHQRARGAQISARDLPKVLHHAVDHVALATDRPEPIDLDDYLSRVETRLVERALELARGNKAEAARLLGVSRPRLYRKLEQLGEPAGGMSPGRPTPKHDAEPAVQADSESPPPADDSIEFLPVEGDD